MLPPSVVEGTAIAAISVRSAPVVTPGNGRLGVKQRGKLPAQFSRRTTSSSSAAPGVSPSGQPGSGMRGHSILRAPALASR